MQLSALLARRHVPAAGVFLALTRRCPLSCAHCSTDSSLASEEYASDLFLDFARTFTPADHPEIVFMTGGEPLLKAGVVTAIAQLVHEAGGEAVLISGMYFADGPVPPAVQRAIDAVDHFVASIDVFHEMQVSRAAVFRALDRIIASGKDVSLQVVGTGPGDPYLRDLTAAARRHFGDTVPMLVAPLSPIGRAAEWLAASTATSGGGGGPAPCSVAAWPVVTFDGTVVACCSQRVVDAPHRAPHLVLGDARVDGWPTIGLASRDRAALRMLRAVGPRSTMVELSGEAGECTGYCETCWQLGAPGTEEKASNWVLRPAFRYIEEQVVAYHDARGAGGFVSDYAVPGFAELAFLDRPRTGSVACAD